MEISHTEHESLSVNHNTNSARRIITKELKTINEENAVLNEKLKFPAMKYPRQSSLLNRSFNLKHLLGKRPIPKPATQILLVDKVCKLSSNPSNPETSYDCKSSFVTDFSLFSNANESSGKFVKLLKEPKKIFKGKSSQDLDEVTSPFSESGLALKVVLTLTNDSTPTSMDFHPARNNILLVGTEIGTIGLWNIKSGERLLFKKFEVKNIAALSSNFKAAIQRDLWISVNKVTWSPGGTMFGVAFSKNLVHLYYYINGVLDISGHLEIEAHDGSVNDMVFSFVYGYLSFITCGDDKEIKVWDADTGMCFHSFGDGNAPVYGLCSHKDKNVYNILSTSIDGKIKSWSCDLMHTRLDFDAPGFGYFKLAYSSDDQRLFSCGFGKDGDPILMEWDDIEGVIKTRYLGLNAPCHSKIYFDTTWNQYLAAGDDHMVKFWDMDDTRLLASTEADGGLPAYPCIRFNKEGSLLAVSAIDNRIKILARDHNLAEQSMASSSESSAIVLTESSGESSDDEETVEGNSIDDENATEFWSLFKFSEPSHCPSLQLSVDPKVDQIVRLKYTRRGNAILALTSDGLNILWKWPRNEQPSTHVSPNLWQPRDGPQFMKNDLANVRPEESIGCFTISKNGAYLISTSGGLITLFNMSTFKSLATFMFQPQRATSISFYPRDNNIIAVGFDDSSIHIYNVRTGQEIKRLNGHSTRVTSLAFSKTLNVLVSAEVNDMIFLWDANEWELLKGRSLQRKPDVISDTHIQFDPDQRNFLVVKQCYLALYEAQELTHINQWVPVFPAFISQADFSSDGYEIYAGFEDGHITILDPLNLDPICKIDPSAYLPPTPSERKYLVALAANPVKRGQFAVGFSDGSVYVMEPPEEAIMWSMVVPYGEEE